MWFYLLITLAIGVIIGGTIVYINTPIDDMYFERKRTYSEYLASEV
jgi:uncharacterized membrane-anchored protein YhcB (DUF1043 family)